MDVKSKKFSIELTDREFYDLRTIMHDVQDSIVDYTQIDFSFDEEIDMIYKIVEMLDRIE